MIALAIGAAIVPPVPLWRSRTTATATLGFSAGAKEMNQVVFTWFAPVSAVPVLPATLTPEICAAVPVPPRDDRLHHRRRRRRRACSLIARPSGSGFVVVTVDPSGAMTLLDDVRPHDDAAVCDRRRDHRHLERRHLSRRSCPKASRPGSTWKSFLGKNSFPSL